MSQKGANRTFVRNIILEHYRPAIIGLVRRQFMAAYPRNFVEKLWEFEGLSRVEELRELGGPTRSQTDGTSGPRDEFDRLDVTSFRNLFDGYFSELTQEMPLRTYTRRDRADDVVRKQLLEQMQRVSDLRNRVSHPTESDLTASEALEGACDCQGILRVLGLEAAAGDLDAIIAHHRADQREERASEVASQAMDRGGTNVRFGLGDALPRKSSSPSGSEAVSESSSAMALPRKASATLIERLVQHYRACIAEEECNQFRFELSGRNQAYIDVATTAELSVLFDDGQPVSAELSLPQRDFLKRSDPSSGDPNRWCLGFPAAVKGTKILPVFVVDIEVSAVGGETWGFVPCKGARIGINRDVLRDFDAEERELLAGELEGEFATFVSRLDRAMEIVEPEEYGVRDLSRVPPLASGTKGRQHWYRRMLVFRGGGPSATWMLRQELERFSRFPRLQRDAAQTSLSGLLKEPRASQSRGAPTQIVQICALNAEQERAVTAAFENDLTVITGPPGTGKSQVVTAIMATALLHGQSVLFASRNNQAVDVVRARFKEMLGAHDWTLRVGNQKETEHARDEFRRRLQHGLPMVSPKEATVGKRREIEGTLDLVRNSLEALERTQTEVESLSDHERRCKAVLPNRWQRLSAEELPCLVAGSDTKLLLEVASALASGAWPGVSLWLKQLILGRRLLARCRSELAGVVSALPASMQEHFRTQPEASSFAEINERLELLAAFDRWTAVRTQLKAETARLEAMESSRVLQARLDAARDDLARWWRGHIGHAWTARLQGKERDLLAMLENYWESAERLKRGALTGQEVKDTNKRRGDLARRITEYLPLWIVTSLSIRNTLPLDPGIFDIVIVDEASQCDVPSALPLLFRARRAVIIGDPAQLKHFSSLKRLDEERISQQTGFGDLLDRWSYVNVSLFDRAAAAVASAGSSPIVLPEHHRSHPEIIEFANQRSYAGMLTIRTEHSKLRVPPGDPRSGVFWHHVSGRVKQRGAGAYNEQEAEQVAKLIQKFRWGDSARTSLGVVTPFRHQVTEIERRVPNQQNRELSPVTIGTVHRFQGDERDVMVFSPVIAEGIAPRTAKWVSLQENLINVAVTRARAALHVVGDREACLRAGGAIAELARYAGDAKAQNLEVLTVEEEVLSRMLTDIGLYFRLRHRIGETSVPCLVVAPTGRRYGIQFADGFFGESDSKQGLPSLSRLTWARIDPEELNSAPERVRSRLERLV